MRMILQVKMPNEPFNAFVKEGSAGKKIQKILEEIKPEAAYFTDTDGQRSALLIVDVGLLKNPGVLRAVVPGV